MSKRYPGNFITGNPVALSQTSNNGVWDLKDNYSAVGNNTWQAAASGSYEIPRSLRFRNGNAPQLNRTPTVAGNRRIWTKSVWVKRGASGDGTGSNHHFVFNSGSSSQEVLDFYVNTIRLYFTGGTYILITTQYYRDYSAWYHIVWSVDTTQASAANRVKLYVNGQQVTNWSTFTPPPQNFDCNNNNTVAHNIGYNGASNYFDGYMADVYHIDGQQLDPSYFGYKDSITGIWQPKKYTGSYGTNGFYLPFNQYTSPIMLGKNSGNPSNLLTYSEQLDNAIWGKPASPVAPVVTANAALAPDGSLTADLVTFAGATTHPVIQEITVPSFTVGDTYTASMYLKTSVAGTYNLQLVYFLTAGGNQDGYCQVTFDSSGVLTLFQPLYTANVSCTAVNVDNGWYRVSVSHKWTTGGAGTTLRMSIGQGSGASSIYAWGGQINLGEGPDEYLQTVASAVNQSFTSSGISVTAGATNDSMVDSPTNIFTSATDIGGVVPGNYCTLNPIDTLGTTLTAANLNAVYSASGYATRGTMAFPSTGKWYYEMTQSGTGDNFVGLAPATAAISSLSAGSTGLYAYYGGGYKYTNGSSAAYGVTFTTGDVIGVAVDSGAGTVTFYKNNVSQGVAFTGLDFSVAWLPFFRVSGSGVTAQTNFGQRPFAYTPPAGFKSLNTTNIQALGTSAVGNAGIQPNKWFDTVLYGGTGAARTITNPGGFVPDLVWTKVRNTTYSHNWSDSARGAGVRWMSDSTAVEGANPNGGVTSFNTTNNNGYNIDGGVEVNENGRPYVSWQWKASPTSGLNIVPYTGTGVARTISHNLGVAPKMMIVKHREAIDGALVYHSGLTSAAYYLNLNTTDIQTSNSTVWNSTAPTSSNFSVGTISNTNLNGGTYVAYLFAEVPGFSKFGSFVGNGAVDGSFVYTGFRPKFILTKASSNSTVSTVWTLFDTSRNPNNASLKELYANQSAAEGTDSDGIDILSNGFKPKRNSEYVNFSGWTYIYAAFAESPFALNNRAR